MENLNKVSELKGRKLSQYNKVKLIVSSQRLISKRECLLKILGIEVKELPMGSGGVLNTKKLKNGSIAVQIGYGHSIHNYAKVAIIK